MNRTWRLELVRKVVAPIGHCCTLQYSVSLPKRRVDRSPGPFGLDGRPSVVCAFGLVSLGETNTGPTVESGMGTSTYPLAFWVRTHCSAASRGVEWVAINRPTNLHGLLPRESGDYRGETNTGPTVEFNMGRTTYQNAVWVETYCVATSSSVLWVRIKRFIEFPRSHLDNQELASSSARLNTKTSKNHAAS